MRIGILGAGAVAFGTAAYLESQGHEAVLWSPSVARTQALARGAALTATGAVEGAFHPRVATTAAEAAEGADIVLLALPANAHRMAFEAVAPHIREGQIVAISSHASFGALALSRLLAERGVSAPIVAWSTTLTSGRRRSGAEVAVSTVRGRVDAATVPAAEGDAALARCRQAFGDRFLARDSLLAIALSNLNPQNHMGIALCNLTRMEKGEAWSQGAHVTPCVGRLLEALDAERLAIAEAFGLETRTIFEHFHLSFHVPVASISEMNAEMAAEGRGGEGPQTAESRYVLEDVPYGLVPTAQLGALVGRPALLHEAGVRLFSALYGRDFEAENDLLDSAGVAGLDAAALMTRCERGFAPA
jgi:opine dehydrogenase